jgi:hypothetical protein
MSKKQELLKQEQEAFLKYHRYSVDGKNFLASY